MELKKNEPVAKVVDSNGYDMSVCTIHPDLQKMLVEQMAHELYNHNLYRAFANFYSVRGLKKLSDYYSRRAKEEYDHWRYTFPRVEAERTEKALKEMREKEKGHEFKL